MKILLVSMPWEQNTFTTPTTDDNSHYPLGLAYLYSYLESKGHVVKTLWLNNSKDMAPQYVLRDVDVSEYNMVGFNVLTMNRVSTYRAIEWVHLIFPNVRIVLGGIHASVMYNQLLREYPYATVIIGEGEETFAELAEGKSNFDIKGIAFSQDGKIYRTPEREPLDLDTLPFPKHELFFRGNRTTAALLTSRGCPNRCSFCCLNPGQHKVRYRSWDKVMEEIKYLVNTFPHLDTIWIHDDSFLSNNTRALFLCNCIELYQKIFWNRKINFICSARVKPLTPELVKALEDANFTMVLMGLESGDPTVLRNCHKGITHEDVINAVTLFKDSPIELALFLIVGLPGESEESIRYAAGFIQSLQRIKYIPYHDIGILAVYPGTEIYQNMLDAGKITDDYWLTDQPTPLYTVDNAEHELFAMKTNLLDSIAFERIITWNGFKKQWRMIPQIVQWGIPKYLKRIFC